MKLNIGLSLFPGTSMDLGTIDIDEHVKILQGWLSGQKGRRPCAPSTDLLTYSLQSVLDDQFVDHPILKGAWSNRTLDGYVKKDTITFSALIVNNLLRYVEQLKDEQIGALVANRLSHFAAYLFRHFDTDVGGFGRFGHVRTDGTRDLEVSFRHTLWGLMALWGICPEDPRMEEILGACRQYLRSNVNTINIQNERAFTFAALHRFLSTPGLSNSLADTDNRRLNLLRMTEDALITKYNSFLNTWDTDKESPSRAAFSVALYILSSVRLPDTRTQDLRSILLHSIEKLITQSVIPMDADGDQLALPFYPEGSPDLGASVQLVSILCDEAEYRHSAGKRLSRLLTFVNNPSNYKAHLEHTYSWHLSSALAMV